MRGCARSPAAVLAPALLAAGILWCALAIAQPSDEARRTTLYREGLSLADQGRWADALERFRAVVAIRSAPSAEFTLGQALEHVGKIAEAEQAYDKALAEARASNATDVIETARKARAGIDKRVPRIILRMEGEIAGVEATIDGRRVGIDDPVRVEPGDHQIVVRAAGNRSFRRTVSSPERKVTDVDVVLEQDAPAAATDAPAATSGDVPSETSADPPSDTGTPPPHHSHVPWGPIFLGGAGIAAGLTGVVVRLAAQSDYNAASSACVAPPQCTDQSLVDAGNGARDRMLVGDIIIGAGAAMVVGAVVWWALGGSKSADARLVPGPGGAWLVGRF
jgi:hypothetical protein